MRGYLVGFALAFGFQLLTLAGRSHVDHLWAEDGARLVLDAETRSFWANLVTPYDGYLHTVPRVVAELMSVLPLTWAPAGFAVFAALSRTVIALVVFAASGGYLRSTPVRVALASLVVVLPAANSEALGNLENLHWFLLFGAFWALLWRPSARGANGLAVSLVLAAALSSPLAFLLLPLAVLRLWLPTWRERWVAVALGVGSLAQLGAALSATRTAMAVDPVQLVLAGLLRVPVVAFTGSEQVAEVYPALHNWPVLIAVVLAAVPIVAAVVRPDGRFLALLGVGYSAVTIVLLLAWNWQTELQVQQPGVVMNSQRFSVAACLFLFTAIAVGLDVLPERGWAKATVLTSRVLVGAAVVVGVVLHIGAGGGLLDGVPWRESVVDARQDCADGAPVAKLVQNPDGWSFALPCDRLPK